MNVSALQFVAFFMLFLCAAHSRAADDSRTNERKPIVAAVWITPGSAGGKEVVIQPDAEKLESQNVTFEQLAKALHGVRFVEGKWDIEIGGNAIDLSNIARLTLRKIKAKPFTVKLRDGREVIITPDTARVGNYVITGEDFEAFVRQELSTFTGPDPAKCNVLSMIEIPGNVGPHLTEVGTMRHFSLGEPLETFAKLEVRRKTRGNGEGESE